MSFFKKRKGDLDTLTTRVQKALSVKSVKNLFFLNKQKKTKAQV